MKYIYPIIISPDREGGFTVSIPDLSIGTQGETVAECMDMSRDAIGLWGICKQDRGEAMPTPATLSPTVKEGDLVSIVDVDLDAYRKAHDMRSVRRNVTLPYYLNELGEKAGLNFSQILQEGLKARLGA